MKRRTFIKNCGYSAIGISGASNLLSGCQTTEVKHAQAVMNENKELSISKSEFATNSFLLLEHPELDHPICLFKTGVDEYSASLMSCTHQRCTTSVVNDFYVCPCHGARFSNKGKVLKGPAEKDLTTYKTRVTDNDIFILVA